MAKPRKDKTSQAKEYKMTRECVYSRAYHQAASKYRKQGMTETQVKEKSKAAGQRALKKVFRE